LGTSATDCSAVFAFGKHPGWDDHIQDIGIANDSIALAKRILYINGIGGIIDSGDWEQAEPGKIATDFDHTFLWLRKDEFLIGRLWPSNDGKGRSKYPMIIGCHLKKVSLNFAFQKVLPYLKTLETKCRSCSKQVEVLKSVEQTQSSICQVLHTKDEAVDKNRKAKDVLQSTESLLPEVDEIEHTEDGWARIFYQIKSQLEHYGYWSFQPKHFAKKAVGAEVLRLPLTGASLEKTVEPWLHFLQRQISPDVPLLFIASEQVSWFDVIVGEPSKRELFNLKASLEAFPYPYQIPYSINDEFKTKCQTVISALVEGKSVSQTCIFDGPLNRIPFIGTQQKKNKSGSELSRIHPSNKKKIKWIRYLFIIGGILLILAIALYFLEEGGYLS
jgi:hypothetical protein